LENRTKELSNIMTFPKRKEGSKIIAVDFCGIKSYMKENDKRYKDLTDSEKFFFVRPLSHN